MIECDECGDSATWFAWAAYDVRPEAIHPEIARYPFPMIRACQGHLTTLIERDVVSQGTTGQFVVRRFA